VKATGASDLVELATNSGHSVPNKPSIGLYLCFAGTAKETETAPLPLQVGPASNKPARLIVEMGQFDLQATFGCCRSFAKDLENQAGPIDHLALGFFFERLLLDGSQRRIDDQQPDIMFLGERGNLFDLPLSEQTRRPDLAQFEGFPGNDIDPDGLGQAGSFFDTGVQRAKAPFPNSFRHDNQRTLAARNAAVFVAVEDAQPSSSP